MRALLAKMFIKLQEKQVEDYNFKVVVKPNTHASQGPYQFMVDRHIFPEVYIYAQQTMRMVTMARFSTKIVYLSVVHRRKIIFST